MGKKNSSNNWVEDRFRPRNISEENLISLGDKETVECGLDNVEPHYFFKGAVLCFIFCLPFWIILFKLIA
jgi:hypothetical protein